MKMHPVATPPNLTQPATDILLVVFSNRSCNTNKPDALRLVCICPLLCLICLVTLLGCDSKDTQAQAPQPPQPNPAEHYPGGETSVSIVPFPSFEKPVQNLPEQSKPEFHAGKALANQPWIKAPTSTTARDGLGPIYNARTCLACHVNGGKGLVPDDDQSPLFSAFVRISIPGENAVLGVNPEPTYGDQLQTQSVSLAHQLRQTLTANPSDNEVMPEAYVYIDWQKTRFIYPDQHNVELRSPKLDIRQLNYGELHSDTLTSLRVAPSIQGMGLIELINQADIDVQADPDDRNHDGISGRINQVWDATSQQSLPGRFGHKANRPNLAMVVAAAFANDVGISNPLFPNQPCTESQLACLGEPNGNDQSGFELPGSLLNLVVQFTQNIAVPVRRRANDPEVLNGRNLFYQSGCSNCHQPSYVTVKSAANPHLSNQTIWPYSDFLLHDMGPGLADGRPDFQASGDEWRTPPLWGVGLNKAVNGSGNLLHDGRARTIEEAILWHAGEARQAQQSFINLPYESRQSLIRFVESL